MSDVEKGRSIVPEVLKRKAKLEKQHFFSRAFLCLLNAHIVLLGEENWDKKQLKKDASNPKILPIFGGLTHKDYIDGLVLALVSDVPLQVVVMKEGFSKTQDGGEKRDALARLVTNGTLPLSRGNPTPSEIKEISRQRVKYCAVGLYPAGNKNLLSDFKDGVTVLVKETDVLYPFVNLSDVEPIFPSGATFEQNKAQLQATIAKREKIREFIYLMYPIRGADFDLMAEDKRGKEKRNTITAKLEVLRALGVLKMFYLIGKQYPDEQPHPLLKNKDNIPLLRKSSELLEGQLGQSNSSLAWLCKSTTNSSEGEKTYIDEEEVALIINFYKNAVVE